ncbi:hypothetical protein, partial [Paenibacillus sp. Y412MC10]|uniref:hypothetical protein n=1 Tax=Geobacillus sp. (strain Y412MC10) TaxID=481743 RepID=UPI00164276B4
WKDLNGNIGQGVDEFGREGKGLGFGIIIKGFGWDGEGEFMIGCVQGDGGGMGIGVEVRGDGMKLLRNGRGMKGVGRFEDDMVYK